MHNLIKSSGEIRPYSRGKLIKSLRNSGVPESKLDQIADEIESGIYEGMPSYMLHRLASKHIRKLSTAVLSRYKLKSAITQLGPTGYPFEKFVAMIFEAEGYKVNTGQVLQGNCIKHEVDVVATKENEIHLAECKFRNRKGVKCDVQVPLYINSRFQDIFRHMEHRSKPESQSLNGWVVTNSKFTTDAITYGKCIGLKLMGWSYPENQALKNKVDKYGLYPVTCIPILNSKEKADLIDKGVILTKQIPNNISILKSIGISDKKRSQVLEICNGLNPKNSIR